MPGTVLLLAASPVGKGRLVDAASVLPVLAAVEPSVLSGADTANVVELADPLEPQAVLTRLRAAATAPGPLTVFVAGQLQLDRKQRLPHLALARTTPATVRYTGFPWAWVREELRLRAPGTTTLLLDLHTDAETWQWLRARPLDSGRTNAIYGRIAPPPARRVVAVPSYMKAVATILRSGWRPPVEQLHQQAVERLGAEGYADVLLASPGFVGAAAVPGGSAPRPPSALKGPRPQTPDGLESTGRWEGERGLNSAPRSTQSPPPPSPQDTWRSHDSTPPGHDSTPPSHDSTPPGHDSTPPSHDSTPPGHDSTPPSHDSMPPGHDTDPPSYDNDPHIAVASAAQAGRHPDADALAAEHEQAAVRAHGRGSEEALHWTEVRADLAMLAGDPVRSCQAWLAVAGARLAAGQAPGAAAVEAAVDRAHHQWGQIHDPAAARELGLALAGLRGLVPGRRKGALDHVRRQLGQLESQPLTS
ncbi:hypothetical protein OG601_16560 [Streptomyces sp. NBC_01239]|uniref:hypothetical protein n=1 Tax=Streptomyces sp. NBC_01239 TaxID=2903792 RepID=UPI0022599B86|nr:hypothetical protein [Streptomyces sp. NBC_01239]MCX4812221.1 hypothetical protein [Streptomyces sp. NBC_01239]